MNEFEKAKLKREKNLARQQRSQERKSQAAPEIAPPIPEPVRAVPVPNGKDALIEITLSLPSGVYDFTFIKRGVLANANPSRMNANEFKNAIRAGLVPLLGRVDEV